uniref:Uncharacterized protein n=1 Tax=viral metagenome TaxID=1070528 RepID=A0A6C0I8F1_9ZZZZ
MLAWIIQISIISLIFIFLVHHLIGFFKTTLTVPKIKDLVNSPSQKYQHIFNTINTNSTNSTNSNTMSYTAIDLLPTSPTQSNSNSELDVSTKDMMKDELKSFLKKQMNTNAGSSQNESWLNINS